MSLILIVQRAGQPTTLAPRSKTKERNQMHDMKTPLNLVTLAALTALATTTRKQNLLPCALLCALACATNIAQAANLAGSVQGAAKPIAGTTVTLYAAGTGAPTQLGKAKTDDQGAFKLTYGKAPADSVLYLIARGGTPKAAADKGPNDAIALLAVLGGTSPKSVVVNEFSTIASVWTSAQFLKGEVLSGTKLGLRIAAGNVCNFRYLDTAPLRRDRFFGLNSQAEA